MWSLPNPFLPPVQADEPPRFVLDEQKFMADLAEMPAFIASPSQDYLKAVEMIPMLAVLAGH